MAQNKLQEGDGNFLPGMNSLVDPLLLPPGMYARACNLVNRGGILQTRPGYRCSFAMPEGRIQGGKFFRPRTGASVLVFGVEGLLYLSEAPFTTFRQLPGVQFSPTAARLFFEAVEDSVLANPDGSLTLVDTKNLLIVQDGGTARPAVFDGTSAKHSSTIPLGGPMRWVGNRLWIGQGTQLIPSDLADPTSFTEYVTVPNAVKSFTLPDLIVGIDKVPSTASEQLIVFTETTTTWFAAGNTDRSSWASTPDFQKTIFDFIGCIAPNSITAIHGKLWWFSAHGLTSMDAAAQANVSSSLLSQDSEMTDSKSRLSTDLSGVAGTAFENYLLMSVPSGDLYNNHTWVMDNAPLQGGGNPAWNSFWVGTRPVQWMSGIVNGQNRSFFFSYDYDGTNRLWEAFTPDREDEGCPITWWVETRALSFSSAGKFKEFRYSDLFFSEVSGLVDIAVFWAGGHRGRYKRILTKRLSAARGSIRSGDIITATQKLFGLKKQSRHLRTQDGRALASAETLESCGVESPNKEFKDEAFQLLIVGSGTAALRGFLAYAEPPKNDDDSARVEDDETLEKFVRFDGAATDSETFSEAVEDFSETPLVFTSVRSVTISQGGLTAVGQGTSESIISQENADLVAERIATRRACHELEEALPKILSVGELANESD